MRTECKIVERERPKAFFNVKIPVFVTFIRETLLHVFFCLSGRNVLGILVFFALLQALSNYSKKLGLFLSIGRSFTNEGSIEMGVL